ncbi:unnamed protein product, partial [Leptidea sinapis]
IHDSGRFCECVALSYGAWSDAGRGVSAELLRGGSWLVLALFLEGHHVRHIAEQRAEDKAEHLDNDRVLRDLIDFIEVDESAAGALVRVVTRAVVRESGAEAARGGGEVLVRLVADALSTASLAAAERRELQALFECVQRGLGADRVGGAERAECFGALCTWDRLSVREQNRMKNTLPPLFTDTSTFKRELTEYRSGDRDVHTEAWFDAMCGAVRSGAGPAGPLHSALAAARRDADMFAISALAECDSWVRCQTGAEVSGGAYSGELASIARGERCVARWAARIMLRACRAQDAAAAERVRNAASAWCKRVLEMELYQQALLCCRSNRYVP